MLRQGQFTMEFTAPGDVYEGVVFVEEIRLVGSGMTIGEQCVVVDRNEQVVAFHKVVAANENEFLRQSCGGVNGLKIKSLPTGSVSVVVTHK